MLQQGIVDLEIIKSILEAAAAIFYGKFAKGESLKAIRRALRELRVAPFSVLGMDLRRKVEKAIADITASSVKRQPMAADVFGAVTAVLDADNATRSSTQPANQPRATLQSLQKFGGALG